jgi:hypothetical protein
MRERSEQKIKEMSDFLGEFDRKEKLDLFSVLSQLRKTALEKHTQQQGSLSTTTDAMLGCRFPQCFICKQEFVNCQHLCSTCRLSLHDIGDHPCPACNKGNHILFGVSNSQQQEMEKIINMNEEDISGSPANENWLPFDSHERVRMKASIQSREKKINYFVDWFIEMYPAHQSSQSIQLITVRNTVNRFVSSIVRAFTLYSSPFHTHAPQ